MLYFYKNKIINSCILVEQGRRGRITDCRCEAGKEKENSVGGCRKIRKGRVDERIERYRK
jgi:hypothetical protein